MSDIDTVAEAIWQAEYPGAALMSTMGRDRYRRMAQAAIDALQLNREWAAVGDADVINGVICVDESTDDYEYAQTWAAERCKSCDHCRNAQPKFIAERLVGLWIRHKGDV